MWQDIQGRPTVYENVNKNGYRKIDHRGTLSSILYAVFSRERFTTVTAYRGCVTKSQLLETLFTRN